MNKICFIIVLLILTISLFGKIPESNLSKKVIKEQVPILKKELNNQGLELGSDVFIQIFKSERKLEVWIKKNNTFQLFKTYRICAYSGAIGTKKREGDLQAPEGFYSANEKSMNPFSSFHLSINVGYPNAYDRAHKHTGDAIMIHGNCVSIGCFAMTNARMEEIYTIVYSALNAGQKNIPIHIYPFRMNKRKLNWYKRSGNYNFWLNLKEGYDLFEKKKIPPIIKVKNKKYVFS